MAKAIARIYEGDTDRAVGVGFWVFPGYLLTCAHVVNQALGWKDDAQGVPEGFIMLDFPDLQHRQRLKGRVVHWLPIDSNWEGDIAVLEVEMPAVEPMSLGQPTGQPLSVSGFPGEYNVLPILDDVKIAAGADLDRGLVQLNTLTGRIQKGFSGSPVWEVQSRTVVGMVTLSDQDSGAGWMVPAQILSQQLSETVLSNIARFIQIEGVSDRCITDLLNILKIDSYRFGLIWKIAKGVLPGNVEENRVDAIQVFQEQHLDTNFFKAFKLLQLFSDDYPNFFADFAVALEHIEFSDPWIRNFQQELTRWKQHYFPTQAIISNTQISAYLMILVEPEEQGSTRASASLRYLQTDGTQKNIPINLDQNAIEPGSACSIAELPALMDQLIRNTTKVLDRPETSNYTLIVELFLPVDFLCEPVDRWTVKDDFGDSVRLGTNYRVVVRSYDRLEKPGLRASLAQSWNRMKLWLEQMDDPNSIAAQIYHAEEIDCSRLNSFSEALKKQLGVKVTCPLPVSAGQRVKILKGILASGVPVAFWMRCSECVRADATVGIDDFLTIGLLRSPPDLLEQVRSQRAIAWDTHGTPEGRWARHLTVLWDDFDRIPSQLDAFREGASRK
jgi:vWA-MoxR associated protein C-terminal domain/Trypsin-like peptidase domain